MIIPKYLRKGDIFDYMTYKMILNVLKGCDISYTVELYLFFYNIYGEYIESKYSTFQIFRDSVFIRDEDQLYKYPRKKIIEYSNYTINKYY